MSKSSSLSVIGKLLVLVLASAGGSATVLLLQSSKPAVPMPPLEATHSVPAAENSSLPATSAKASLEHRPEAQLAAKEDPSAESSETAEAAPPKPAEGDEEAPLETAAGREDDDSKASKEQESPAESSVQPAATASTTAPDPGSLKPPYRHELDGALAPLLNYTISDADLAAVKEAARLIDKENFDDAREQMAKITDKAAKKFVLWYLLRASGADAPYGEIVKFREENPLWPSKSTLDAGIEAGILFQESNPRKVIEFFKNRPPQTGAGKAAYGGALIATGNTEQGKALISEAWRRHLFDNDIEAKISERFGSLLTESDNRARLYWLMAEDPKKKASAIQKLRKKLQENVPMPAAQEASADKAQADTKGKDKTGKNKAGSASGKQAAKVKAAKAKAVKAKVQAARKAAGKNKDKTDKISEKPSASSNAVQAKDKPANDQKDDHKKGTNAGAQTEAKASPETVKIDETITAEAKKDPGFMLARIKDLRKKGQSKAVWDIMASMPGEALGPLEAPDWWEERRTQVRYALNAGFAKTAYDIAENHGSLTGDNLAEAEFLAGWIALRFLQQPQKARDHFAVAAAAGGLPKERARASYWLGRAETVLGHKQAAEAAYREAAQYNHTFYGQLSRSALGGPDMLVEFREPYKPSPSESRAFAQKDLAKAVIIAQKAGLTKILPVFFLDLARNVEDPADMALFAELALRLVPLNVTVRFAKIALNRGFAVEYYAFPASLPKAEALKKDRPVETALLHALTRQESEFNPGTVSTAGARGLMQLLPSTAKLVARTYSVKYDPKRLDEPAFNVMLGTAFLQEMVGSYDGSYIMALAAYNAGPGRVREWVGQFGDPRSPKVDPIDWIERIPFTETRDYVHKIMESLQMYRAKFNEQGRKAQLAQDVYRGRPATKETVLQAGAAN